ncbi:MAG: hypothetical protein MOB07_31530 [Acidobacteria bacterium]|nr:hypothetical protein [Acidobacteriota bacterium]
MAQKAQGAREKKKSLKPVKHTEDPDGTVRAWYRIADLILDPDPVRLHNARNLDVIGESVLDFEQQKPVVIDAKGIVRAGNGTCEALTLRGVELVWGVRSTLRDQIAADYAKDDNRTAELSNWNYQRLTSSLRTLQKAGIRLDRLGWPEEEMGPLLQTNWSPPPPLPNDLRETTPEAEGEEHGAGELPEAVSYLFLTDEQWSTVSAAIAAMHVQLGETVPEGEALRQICLDWIEQCKS